MGPLLEISSTAEYGNPTKCRKSVVLDVLNAEILQCLANQQSSNDQMNRKFSVVAASDVFKGRRARHLSLAPPCLWAPLRGVLRLNAPHLWCKA